MSRAVRRNAVLLLPALLAVWVGSRPADAKPGPEDLYVRDVASVQRAVEVLAEECRRSHTGQVLVAFDQITFDPPPGRSEYRYDHAYDGDVDAWVDALGAWARTAGFPIRAVATLGDRPVLVGEDDWAVRLRAQLELRWWKGEGRAFESALWWMRRWMPRGGSRKRPGRVVLLASEMTPERWADPHAGGEAPEPWRERLLAVGAYWDAEAIGRLLDKAGCVFDVVAPEVRFGDESPLPTLPELPWAARPQRAPPNLFGSGGSDEDEAYDLLLREDLDRELRAEFPDPVERREQIDEILRRPEDAGRTVPGKRPGTDEAEDDVPVLAGGRFTSGPPSLFPWWRGTVLFANDVPSGFGYWPYARTAHRSGGRYVCYPFGSSGWLDVCPRDAQRLRRLAPSLEPERRLLQHHRGDRALEAMCKAAAYVAGVTPWADSQGGRVARTFSAFASATPPKRAAGFRVRRRAWDPRLRGSADALQGSGADLKSVVVHYDEAMRLLDAALAAARPGKAGWPERSVADLRLLRFWFAMSAFHLDGIALCLRKLDRHLPPNFDRGSDDVHLTPLVAVKLSDVLDAYDGQTLPPESESHYPRALHRAWTPRGWEDGQAWWEPGTVVPGQQGNVLQVVPSSAEFRARREDAAVLKHVDPYLRKRAVDMVEAARRVMAHDAKTPWGWTVYYTEARCYVVDAVDRGLDVRPRSGDEDDTPERPFSPTRPGGSAPGGPTTK